MGLGTWLGLGKPEATLDAGANLVKETGNVFDNLFTSDEERAAGQALLAKIKQNPAKWAQQLNVLNAKSLNWFNSGWRPALGWVGAISVFFYYVPQFIVASFIWIKACLLVLASMEVDAEIVLPAYPVDDTGLWQLIGLLLGGATIRTVEKVRGVAG